MSNSRPAPPDQAARERALDPRSSVLVQAPAGSGKTDLLTRRFLRLLAQVDDPARIVAITFTKAAAAEMRHRILDELEKAAVSNSASADAFAMEALALRALNHSQALGWNLLDQSAQLRISTIDSFCREIALQQPLLSGLGDGLAIYEHPEELYRRAARNTLERLDSAAPALRTAIEDLLLWRDNNWNEMETLLVEMLASRDRWMHGFVLDRDPDWPALRARLEQPFANRIQESLTRLASLLDQVPEARGEALRLARFACENGAAEQFQSLAELADFPSIVFEAAEAPGVEQLEESCRAYNALATLLLTLEGAFRKSVDKRLGFPADRKAEKARLLSLIASLAAVPGLDSALAQVRSLPPVHYSEDEWQILQGCFALLRHAAAELRVVFAEVGAADYVEVAQIALNVLCSSDGLPSEAAFSIADGIQHILVDEFQDTSRRQHELLRRLVAAWPEREGRSCFVVGDPMQSIYFFRGADAELFPRVRESGLEIPSADPLLFDPLALKANFRTARPLVVRLNEVFSAVFAADDGSGVTFDQAAPARADADPAALPFNLHVRFLPQASLQLPDDGEAQPGELPQAQEIVSLIESHMPRIEQARANGLKYRIAVLGRTRAALAPIAERLRGAAIPFRAVDLERLSSRPEVLDVLALARALLNPLDRVAWLGVLRAPWCGLSLSDLHLLTSADDPKLLARSIPDLLAERATLLSPDGRLAIERVINVLATAPALRFARPTSSLGTWLEQIWLQLGGAHCVDATGRANLDLLWSSLDSLPDGEQDLLGPALTAALDKLTAQPDPQASSECGVQLMTIHKSKGLEFEVVIVPSLEAGARRGAFKMLSWLERGLPPEAAANDADQITEFLVAPLQSKGSDRSGAKAWVDRAFAARELQEMRRLLYVAATRARDELHLFARPSCRQGKNGEWVLAEPSASLLGTAWPALKAEIEERFEQWKSAQTGSSSEPSIIDSLAASGESNLIQMPSAQRPTLLRRLPADYSAPQSERAAASTTPIIGIGADSPYQRHEGGLQSRALGVGVHTLLEMLARQRERKGWDAAHILLQQMQPRIAAQVRAAGVDGLQANRVAAVAVEIALNASRDAVGQWILSPHADASSEARWVGVVNGNLRTVQVDRVFRAGAEPLSNDGNTWWIVDYKTAHADGLDPAIALPQLRAVFAPQLEAYAEVLRKLRGSAQIHAGLYYPRMSLFDWWQI